MEINAISFSEEEYLMIKSVLEDYYGFITSNIDLNKYKAMGLKNNSRDKETLESAMKKMGCNL